jgi:hypothetical protein
MSASAVSCALFPLSLYFFAEKYRLLKSIGAKVDSLLPEMGRKLGLMVARQTINENY